MSDRYADCTAMLDVQDITTYYGNIHALKGISLNVDQGEIVTLIGSNGAGKSTTLTTISGLISPRTGTDQSERQAISDEPAHKMAAMGVAHVARGAADLPPHVGAARISNGRVLPAASPIPPIWTGSSRSFPAWRSAISQKAGTMSGGEQQMLAIGRALMAQPTLLLLDEPSMGLSPILVEAIFKICVEINAQGTTVLLVEQNALMALAVAHRGYVHPDRSDRAHRQRRALLGNDMVRKAYLGEE